MGGFDIVVIGVFVISIVIGIMRGLIKESLSIASWIVSIWLAATFKVQAGELFAQYVTIPNPTFRIWIGFGLVFIVSLFVFAVINYIVTKLLVRGPIKGTDRFLGIFFGAARAALIVVAFMILFRGLGFSDAQWWKDSKFIPVLTPVADFIEPMVFDHLPQKEEGDEKTLQDQVIDHAVENFKKQASSTGEESAEQVPQNPN